VSGDDEARARDRAEKLGRINQAFIGFVPHNGALGLTVVEFGRGVAVMRLPYDPRLVGNPETGVLHGGAVTALIDACSGASVFMRMQAPVPIATLDLRIDYLRPATPSRDVFARAECYKLASSIAFVRAVAYHDTPDDPIAASASTFMISTRGRSAVQRAADANAADADDEGRGPA